MIDGGEGIMYRHVDRVIDAVTGYGADEARVGRAPDRLAMLAAAQGIYWVASGVWALLSRRSFEAVTGPKTDYWLVQTVGGLLAAIGTTLLLAARNGRISPEIRLLGASSATVLAGIDIAHSLRARISPIYLAEAVVELGFVAGWAVFDEAEGAPKSIGLRTGGTGTWTAE